MSCIPYFIASIRCQGTQHNEQGGGGTPVTSAGYELQFNVGMRRTFYTRVARAVQDMQPARADTAHPMSMEQGTRADYNCRGADKILIQIQKLRLLRMNPGVYHIE